MEKLMSDNKLVILNETFGKEGSDEKVEGLTLIIDGQIKVAFEAIKAGRNYESYNEVLRDIVFSVLDSLLNSNYLQIFNNVKLDFYMF